MPGSIEVLGEAQPDATVTITFPASGGTIYPTTRQDGLFHRQLTIDNTQGAQFPALTITGVRNNAGPNGEDAVTEETKSTLVPQTPEAFVHDADGNLTEDARWTYTWDGENRLVAMESTNSSVAAGAPQQKLEFTYDGQSRRIAKKVFSWSGSAWELDTSLLFAYDGWNLIAELDATNSNVPVRTYVWALDLSGTMQGAGGVGGLLFTALLDQAGTYASSFDGNGNVIGYKDMATGMDCATFEYGVFGETLRADGLLPAFFALRFSAKYSDDESGLLYYGHRFYSPTLGRWIGSDPLAEIGSALIRAGNVVSGSRLGIGQLLAFVANDPVSEVDVLGLVSLEDAARSLLDRSGVKVSERRRAFVVDQILQYRRREVFEEWVRLEEANDGWWKSLPKCPLSIKVCDGKAENPDPKTWTDPNKGFVEKLLLQKFHRGAVYEMRTVAGLSSAPRGNQCTYDGDGNLLTGIPAAGTVDYISPNAPVDSMDT